MMNRVIICGIPYEVQETEENFSDGSCGVIHHREQLIKINKNMGDEYKEQTLMHEIIHGVLVCIGRDDLSNSEEFVQALANGLYTSSISIDPNKTIAG